MYKFILLVLICSFNRVYGVESCLEKWKFLKSNHSIPEMYRSLEGLCENDFRRGLSEIISTNKDLGYNNARKIMFSDLDNYQGQVCDAYTSFCMNTDGIPDSTQMNCEHTWPQSKGAIGIAKSDLNHLFPAGSKVNSIRSNFPFCEVEKSTWSRDGSALGSSSYGTKCFEPRDQHKGAVARALIYFSVRYEKALDPQQEFFIRDWNDHFFPTSDEVERNNRIEEIQNNRNPFIDVPYFAKLIADF